MMSNEHRTDTINPSFILSHARAGSTLLRYIVDTHPDICSPGELYLGRLCAFLGQFADMTVAAVSNISDPIERHRFLNSEVRRIADGLMEPYVRGKGKRTWCEKTPKNVDFVDTLLQVYPEAKYICLHRHCMDVVYSCLEAAMVGLSAELPFYARNGNNQINVWVDSWVERTSKILAFEKQHGSKCIRVKYESLVLEPEKILRPMFEFLGVSWDESIIEKVFSVPHDRGRAPGDEKVTFSNRIHRNSLGRGSSIPWQAITPQLLEKMNALLRELGYPQVGPNWEQSLDYSAESVADSQPQREIFRKTEEVFTVYFPNKLRAYSDRLDEIGGTFKFNVSGEDGGTWILDLTETGGQVYPGDAPTDCVLSISSHDLISIVNGELNAAEAMRHGKLRINGDILLVSRMGQTLLV